MDAPDEMAVLKSPAPTGPRQFPRGRPSAPARGFRYPHVPRPKHHPSPAVSPPDRTVLGVRTPTALFTAHKRGGTGALWASGGRGEGGPPDGAWHRRRCSPAWCWQWRSRSRPPGQERLNVAASRTPAPTKRLSSSRPEACSAKTRRTTPTTTRPSRTRSSRRPSDSSNFYDERFDLFGFPSAADAERGLRRGPARGQAADRRLQRRRRLEARRAAARTSSIAILDTGIKWERATACATRST